MFSRISGARYSGVPQNVLVPPTAPAPVTASLETEVGQTDVALQVQQDVLGLQVTVDDVVLVQLLEREDDLGGKQTRLLLREAAVLLEPEEELATAAVVHDEVELVGRLEGVRQAREVRVLDALQDAALRLGVQQLVALDQRGLAQRLHGVDHLGVLLAHHHDLAEAALAQHLEQVEVLHVHLGLRASGAVHVLDRDLLDRARVVVLEVGCNNNSETVTTVSLRY